MHIKVSFNTIQVKEENNMTYKYKPRKNAGAELMSDKLDSEAREKGKHCFNKNSLHQEAIIVLNLTIPKTRFHKCKAKLDRIKRNRPQNHERFNKSLQ